MNPEELKDKIYRLNWIKILKEAVDMRPTSWGNRPVIEWRNASDCVCVAVIKALEAEGIIPNFGGRDTKTRKEGRR